MSSPSKVTFTFWPAVADTFWETNPTDVTSRVTPALLETFNVKFPSKSVLVPDFSPITRTLAPAIAWFFLSFTVPEIVDWAIDKLQTKKVKIK